MELEGSEGEARELLDVAPLLGGTERALMIGEALRHRWVVEQARLALVASHAAARACR